MKYHPDMSDEDKQKLKDEIEAMDKKYAEAFGENPPTDLDDEESKAYFERYIAGDK